MIATDFLGKGVPELIADNEREYLNAAKSGILYLNQERYVMDMNQEAEQICFVKRSEAIGLKAEQAFQHLGEKFTKIFRVSRYEDYSSSVKLKNAEGCTYVHVDTLRLHSTLGAFMGYIVILQDVTAVHAAFKQIQTTQMLLSLGELAAGVAHHIRTPLTTISGYLQVMMNRLQDERYVVKREVLEVLLGETTYINQVIKDLVLFAKPPVSKQNAVVINRILEEALLLNFRDFGGENIEIDKRLAENLPVLYADPNLLQQAFVNIIQNALEAMPQDGVITLKSWLHADLNMIVVSINDTGPGVSREILSKVFEPFYTSKLDHMGLGLPIAHRIIMEHGGFINITDAGSGGTKVNIYLPVVDRRESAFPKVYQQILSLQ